MKMGADERKVIVHDVLPKVKVHDVLLRDRRMRYQKVSHYAEKKVTFTEKYGLYGSSLLIMVQTAQLFDAQIKVTAKGKTIDAKSILMLAALGIRYGDEMTISAEGIDAQIAVDKLCALVKSDFDKEKARTIMDKTQFTMLGMSGSGKTCYLLGMYDEMLGGMKGFTLSTDDDTDVSLRQRYAIIDDANRGQGRFPAGTDQIESYEFQLEHGYAPIMSFDWLDYPGGMLDVKTSGNNDEYNKLEEYIKNSSSLFICADGSLLQGDDDNEDKARLLKRKCTKLINPFIGRYLKNNNFLPPTAIVITKSDLCRGDVTDDDLRVIIEEAFNPLFEKTAGSNRFVSIIPVSLGNNISENDYKGTLNPKGIELPIFMGVWFALEFYKYFARKEVALLEKKQRGFEYERDEEKDKWFSFFRTDDDKVRMYDRQAKEMLEERLSVNAKIEEASENQNKLMVDLEKKVALVYFNGNSYESFYEAAAKYLNTRR